jgi:CheY-like chemotaxis protein
LGTILFEEKVMQPMYNDEDIFIVEDDSLLNGHICEVLLELGFTVAGCASSGVEALSFVEQKPPALALVDIHLNGPMDGIELNQLLRNDSAYSRFSFPVSATTRPLSERERHAPWASFRRLFGRARYSVLLIERLTIGWIDVPGTPSGINSSFLPCR